MSRPAVAALGAVLLVAGFVGGRASRPASGGTTTVERTVERTVVRSALHRGFATDPVERGPLDLVRVEATRRGALLTTTIVAARPWRDSLLRRGRDELAIVYDTNDDGLPDRRDRIFLFHGRLTSWISTLHQGVQAADVSRPRASTVAVARDATVFYGGPGQGPLLTTSPIGVAVVAHWRGGSDRIPGRGWITVPPPRRP